MPIKRDPDSASTSDTPQNPPPPPKKAKFTSPKKSSSASPKKAKEGIVGKKMGSWSGDEQRMLYSIMCPKKCWSGSSGRSCRTDRGREVKACQNKWFRMQSKIMRAIESMGE